VSKMIDKFLLFLFFSFSFVLCLFFCFMFVQIFSSKISIFSYTLKYVQLFDGFRHKYSTFAVCIQIRPNYLLWFNLKPNNYQKILLCNKNTAWFYLIGFTSSKGLPVLVHITNHRVFGRLWNSRVRPQQLHV
jgi:hypothetical protein